MLNLVELGSYHLPLIHFVPKMRFVLLSEKFMGFNRKEDFRSSFKEDRKSNEAQRGVENNVKQRMAVHQAARPCGSGRGHARSAVHPGMVKLGPSRARPAFFRLFICLISYFWGDFSDFFRALLGRITV